MPDTHTHAEESPQMQDPTAVSGFREEQIQERPQRTQEQLRWLLDRFRFKNISNPDLPSSGGSLSRTVVPMEDLNEDDIRQLGFVPSYVAVPEGGQEQVATFRHPNYNIHMHNHGDQWLMHEDTWPSLSMVLRRRALEQAEREGRTLTGKDASFIDRMKATAGLLKHLRVHDLTEAAKHVGVEGVSGYSNYIASRIMGDPSFMQLITGRYSPRTLTDKAARVLLATSAAAAPGIALDKPGLAGGLGGGMAGYLLGHQAGKAVGDEINGAVTPGEPAWAAVRLLTGVALPAAGAIGGQYVGRKIAKRLMKDEEELKSQRKKKMDQKEAADQSYPFNAEAYLLGYTWKEAGTDVTGEIGRTIRDAVESTIAPYPHQRHMMVQGAGAGAALGGVAGGAVGAAVSKKNRLRNALIGALVGGVGGVGLGALGARGLETLQSRAAARDVLADGGVNSLPEAEEYIRERRSYNIPSEDMPYWEDWTVRDNFQSAEDARDQALHFMGD